MLTTCLATLLMANPSDFRARSQDWRIGAVVYQVFVDRFAPSADIAAKRSDYPAPKVLKTWSETPMPGTRDDKAGVHSHELEFWGGDFKSLRGKLDYIQTLGADAVYLMPVFQALTNHKYDTQDYRRIAPEYGTKKDFEGLVKDVHKRGMKLMLDGVFNHMGRTSPRFRSAMADPKDPRRDWFYFGSQYPSGYRGWAGVANLPALRLENPVVRDYLWRKPDSVVQSYLKQGIDGWRLDVAFELGPTYLTELTKAAHKAKPGSAIVGEILGYPADWSPAVDGVCNFFALQAALQMVRGQVTGGRTARVLDHMVEDAGIEPLLKSWLLLDNHDTWRVADEVPDQGERRLLELLQTTLPGCPLIYYGSELGMKGQGDPQNRAPMRWDLVNGKNKELAWMKRLLQIRRSRPALRYGDFKTLDSQRLLAFVRTTDRIADTTIVIVNPTDQDVEETFPTRVGKLMSWGRLEDLLTKATLTSANGMLKAKVPPLTAMILAPVVDKRNGYSPYDRVDKKAQ